MPRTNADVWEIKADAQDMKTLYKAFKTFDKEMNDILKRDVQEMTEHIAQQLKMEAGNSPMPRQAALVANSIKARRDRIPTIVIGGGTNAKVSGKRNGAKPKVGELVFGNEFGAKRTFKQGGARFPARSPRKGQGNTGYWIFPTLERLQPWIARTYHKKVWEIVNRIWVK